MDGSGYVILIVLPILVCLAVIIAAVGLFVYILHRLTRSSVKDRAITANRSTRLRYGHTRPRRTRARTLLRGRAQIREDTIFNMKVVIYLE